MSTTTSPEKTKDKHTELSSNRPNRICDVFHSPIFQSFRNASLTILITFCYWVYKILSVCIRPFQRCCALNQDGISAGSSGDVAITIEDALKWSTDEASNQHHKIYPCSSRGAHFYQSNRVVHLRAINLSGESKLPSIEDEEKISFIGRPFPLETEAEVNEAKIHLARLRSWGFNSVRLVTSWEAMEHAGPGIYDYEYIKYFVRVVRLCHAFGIGVLVDVHQDVWSRFSGGDGAPRWTLDAAGFNVENLYKSGAAIDPNKFPHIKMLWFTNYNCLAASTMFTLFFAGDAFAPSCRVHTNQGEVSIQEYLQSHYLACVKLLAEHLKDEPNVIGYDTLNEPSNGYVGIEHLQEEITAPPIGLQMSAFTSIVIPSGFVGARSVPLLSPAHALTHMPVLNPDNLSAWKHPSMDIWRNEKIWDFDGTQPRLLRPYHFSRHPLTDKPIRFLDDFMVPFYEKFADAVHSVHPSAIIFAEPTVNPAAPVHEQAPSVIINTLSDAPSPSSTTKANKYAWAPHFYDGFLLITKRYNSWVNICYQTEVPVFGKNRIERTLEQNLAHVKDTAQLDTHAMPCFIGEIGIPMDLNDKRAYTTGDFTQHVQAMNRSCAALEGKNILSHALWNYCPNNTNARGDFWNGEDLSVFSVDQRCDDEDVHSGGRALRAVIRPYGIKVSGIPLEMTFDPMDDARPFQFKFETFVEDEEFSKCSSVFFVPRFQYPNGISCTVSDGTYQYHSSMQILLYEHDVEKTMHCISICKIK